MEEILEDIEFWIRRYTFCRIGRHLWWRQYSALTGLFEWCPACDIDRDIQEDYIDP
jgi:hypothetical protein